jgi:hypothetical protein
MASKIISMNHLGCPSQFDVDIYRTLHDDLATMSVEQAVHHYFEFGEDEGRRSHSLSDRMQFGQLAPERTLEIGPFAFPCLRGEKIKYADIYSTEKLRDIAKTSGFDHHSVPEIHYVVEPTNLSAIAGRFDGVFSSHVIEHQPDLVSHLQQVSRLLEDGGSYFLAIPDHRYCFDHFKPAATIEEVLGAHLDDHQWHTARSVVQRLTLLTHNDEVRHWAGDHGCLGENPSYQGLGRKELLQRAVDEFRSFDGKPPNEHSWFFTPRGFRGIIQDLLHLNLIDFEIAHLYPTMWNSIEFWVILSKVQRSD